MKNPDHRLQFTRGRDLALVFALCLAAAYLLTRLSYSSLPVLPRLAGLSAAVLGIGEAIAGFNLRARIRQHTIDRDHRADPRHPTPGPSERLSPVPPLTAARALMVAKASALAGAGLTGLWAGFLLYVLPRADSVVAAGTDTPTAVIGVLSAVVLAGGALWLERCCVSPDSNTGPGGPA